MRKVVILGYGYIGQALAQHLNATGKYALTVVDCEYKDVVDPALGMLGADGVRYIKTNYGILDYSAADEIILLAGLSSVKACWDQRFTFKDNVQYFLSLLEQIKPHQRLIYASSASVYGDSGAEYVTEDRPFSMPRNFYDQSKQMIDMLAHLSDKRVIGLRFGTVCGHSPAPRLELMINSMVRSAVQEGVIRVCNVGSYRAILGMNDLCRGIEAILENDSAPSGPYNMASLSSTIGGIARAVRAVLQDKRIQTAVVPLPNTPTYSFAIDTGKFEKTFDFKFTNSVRSIVEDALRNKM